MSWRVLEETKAKIGDDGLPSFEIIVGWDVANQGFFVLAEDRSGNTERRTGSPFFFNEGHDGSMPTLEDLVRTLYAFYVEGFIFWPIDTALLAVLDEDRTYNVTTDRQDNYAVANLRRVLVSPEVIAG